MGLFAQVSVSHNGVSPLRVFEVSPFYNESLILDIKARESASWVSELHITEANQSFRGTPKPFNFSHWDNPHIRYHQILGEKAFRQSGPRLTRRFPYVTSEVNPWTNEAIQRNFGCEFVDPEDNDLVVLSDVDEIIDPRCSDRIIDQVRQHGIVTVGLHFSLYFFNLVSENWPGPPDYAYRVFVMTGKRFRSLGMTSDQLRKAGEHGRLLNTVHRVAGISGFHHSWLGDSAFIASKLTAYSHTPEQHAEGLFRNDGTVEMQQLAALLQSSASVFGPTHRLRKRDDLEFLASVEGQREQLTEYFI